MGCQFIPDARAVESILSSAVVHIAALRLDDEEGRRGEGPAESAREIPETDELRREWTLLLVTLGMIVIRSIRSIRSVRSVRVSPLERSFWVVRKD